MLCCACLCGMPRRLCVAAHAAAPLPASAVLTPARGSLRGGCGAFESLPPAVASDCCLLMALLFGSNSLRTKTASNWTRLMLCAVRPCTAAGERGNPRKGHGRPPRLLFVCSGSAVPWRGTDTKQCWQGPPCALHCPLPPGLSARLPEAGGQLAGSRYWSRRRCGGGGGRSACRFDFRGVSTACSGPEAIGFQGPGYRDRGRASMTTPAVPAIPM